jgi:hypothetical protein
VPKTEAPKAQPKPTPAKAGANDGIFDKNNLFKQSWNDGPLAASAKQTGDSIQQAKKTQAHSYVSSYTSVDATLKNLQAYDAKLTIDTFIVKAASKAFAKTFKASNIDVNVVQKDGVQVIKAADKLLTSQIKGAE